MNSKLSKSNGFTTVERDGEHICRIEKCPATLGFGNDWKVLSLYRVSSGCQFLGWVARCEYEGGGIEWLAKTRDGATSTVQLITKVAAAELLADAYRMFTLFDSTTYARDSESKAA